VRRARGPSTALVLGLAGGAAGLGLVVIVLLTLWLVTSPQRRILGHWESIDQPPAGALEFRADGTLIARPSNGATVQARYRFLDSQTLELELPNPLRQMQQAVIGRLPRLGQALAAQLSPETIRGTATIVSLSRRELVLRTPDGLRRFQRGD
jgi:hypothetical protein